MPEIPLPVLNDHLHTVLPEQDADDVHLWAQYPWAVRLLMLDKETAYDSEYGGRCRTCDESWAEYSAEHHTPDCKYVEALRVLKHWKLEFVEASAKRHEQELLDNAATDEDYRRSRSFAVPVDAHFADRTTRELEQEAPQDSYGRPMVEHGWSQHDDDEPRGPF